jgi:peptide/nickel transport system permease protein
MWVYVIRRTLYMIPTIFGVALLTFLLFSFFGEDPVRVILGNHASEQAIAELRSRWGLDKTLFYQFVDYLRQIVTFDYGVSFISGESITEIFKQGALVSLALTAPPFFLGTIINVIIAVVIAYFRGSRLDRISTFIFVVSMSVSYLVYIIVFQYFFSYYLDLFPIQGFETGFAAIKYLMLPWLIIIIVSMGPDVRIYRTIFLDQVKADYVRTARAKGASESRVLCVHLMKNAMIPILTNTVIAIPFLITGAFVMERFFSIPGVGDMTITAINEGDFPIIKAMTIIFAIMFSVFNLLTDLLYAAVDPRVKFD